MATITVADLTNAKDDVQTIAEVAMVGYTSDTTTNRDGDTIYTLQGMLKQLGYIPPIAYAGAIAFSGVENTKTVERSGIVYAPLPSALPFTTTGTWTADDETKFFVVQIGSVATLAGSSVTVTVTGLAATDAEAALQELENENDAMQDDISKLVALSGVAADSTDMGTFTGATIPDGSDIKECLQALETKVELAAIVSKNTTVTVTVGGGGDYATVTSALEYLTENFMPAYVNGGFAATISLLTGFAWAEQVHIKGIDCGWITITGVDASTSITRSALTTSHTDPYGTYPAILVTDNGVGPVIDQLFVMDTSGTGTSRCGIVVNNNSRIIIESGAGVQDCPGYGLHVSNCSIVKADGADFSGSGIGIFAYASSNVSAASAVLDSCTTYGVYAIYCSMVSAVSANCSSSGIGVVSTYGSTVNFTSGDATSYTTYGISASNGGKITAPSASCRKTVGVNNTTDIYISTGGIITCHSATGGTNKTKNAISTDGIIFG